MQKKLETKIDRDLDFKHEYWGGCHKDRKKEDNAKNVGEICADPVDRRICLLENWEFLLWSILSVTLAGPLLLLLEQNKKQSVQFRVNNSVWVQRQKRILEMLD